MTDLAALIAASPYYRFLGLQAGPDGTVVLAADGRHANDPDRALVHGGVLAALLEATAALHLRATAGPHARTVDLTVAYLRPAAVTETTARARAVRRGRRFAHLEVTAWQADPGAPVALAHGTWILGAEA